MKKSLLMLAAAGMITLKLFSQSNGTDFDKKWRFGLRVNPQGCWLVSEDKNNIAKGWKTGIGFGLNVEYRFSQVAGILSGIGGDFEGGTYQFKYDPANNYVVSYWRDADDFVSPDSKSTTRTQYILKERTINTTHVTVPFILKLNTQEYDGFKYFGQFGVELGVRIKGTSTDSYYETRKMTDTIAYTVLTTDSKEKGVNLNDDMTLIPLRLGLNAGLGFEYRLGGTTSAFVSINFFRSFINMMKKESEWAYYRIDTSPTTYRYIKQNLKQSAIRLNLGIMF